MSATPGGSSPTNVQLALDPSTTAAQLQELAASDFSVHELVARHPNAYPGLLEWIASMTGPPRRRRAFALTTTTPQRSACRQWARRGLVAPGDRWR